MQKLLGLAVQFPSYVFLQFGFASLSCRGHLPVRTFSNIFFVGEQQEEAVGSGLWENSRRSPLGQVCRRTAGGGCSVRFVGKTAGSHRWVRFVEEQQKVAAG